MKCVQCGKNEAVDEAFGLCRECLAKKRGGDSSNYLTYEQFKDKYLSNKYEGLFWADDALLQYQYYKADPKFPKFDPILGNEYWEFEKEHEKLRVWYQESFYDLLTDRIKSVNTIENNEFSSNEDEIKELFFEFNKCINKLICEIQEETYISNSCDEIINISLKKQIRTTYELMEQHHRPYPKPDVVDTASNMFDAGSGLYFLELFFQLMRYEYVCDVIEFFKNNRSEDIISISEQPKVVVIPWKHQKEAVSKWRKAGKNGVVEMATATGKTVVGLLAIEELWKKSLTNNTQKTALIICHSRVILNQWRREVIEKMGLIGDKNLSYKHAVSSGGITIRFETVQTLSKKPPEFKVDLLIIDEVHHIAAPKFRQSLKVNSPWQIGLTADLGQNETKRNIIKRELGDVVFKYPIIDALKDGIIPSFYWVVNPVYLNIVEEDEFIKLSKSIISYFLSIKSEYGAIRNLGDFIKLVESYRLKDKEIPEDWKKLQALILKRRQILYKSLPRLDRAVKLSEKLGNEHKIIMFLMDIESCENIRRILTEKGIENIFVIHSKIKEDPSKVVQEFKKSEHGILIGANMLNEGIDIPSADIGINAAFSKSELQLIQRMGRVLRKDGDKKPTFYQFVAIPDRNAYLDIMDADNFIDDFAWVQATALHMGLDLNVEWDSEELLKYRNNVEKFYRDVNTDIDRRLKVGTFNLDYAAAEFSKTAIKRIPSILKIYPKDVPLTDAQWNDIIRVAHSYVEDGVIIDDNKLCRKHVNINKSWYILILCNRDVSKISNLFEEKGSEFKLDYINNLPPLHLDEYGMIKADNETSSFIDEEEIPKEKIPKKELPKEEIHKEEIPKKEMPEITKLNSYAVTENEEYDNKLGIKFINFALSANMLRKHGAVVPEKYLSFFEFDNKINDSKLINVIFDNRIYSARVSKIRSGRVLLKWGFIYNIHLRLLYKRNNGDCCIIFEKSDKDDTYLMKIKK